MSRRRIAFVIPPHPGRDVPDAAGLPLGALYLAGSLPAGWDAVLIDAYSHPSPIDDVVKRVAESLPDVAAISIPFSAQTAHLRELTAGIRAAIKDVSIIAGGPHVSFMPERILGEFPEIDILVLGEGERVLDAILTGVGKEMVPSSMAGMAYREDGGPRVTGMPELTVPLDSIPLPDYSIIPDISFYAPRIITSRGCPYKCAFCAATNFWGKWRGHSPQRVVDEFERAIHTFGKRKISIGDDNFTVDRERVMNICDEILRRNLGINFGISAHVSSLDEELIQAMASAGMDYLFIGVESGEPRIRSIIGKEFDESRLRRILDACGQHGVHVHASFMLGIPGETEDDLKTTLAYASKLNAGSLGFHIFDPLPGSEMASEAWRNRYELMDESDAGISIDARCRIRTGSLHPLTVLDYYYRGRAIAATRGTEGEQP